jgi:hypothetical protein
MGYRSEVAIKVYGDDEGMLEFKKAFDEAHDKLLPEEQGWVDDLMREEEVNGFEDNVFTFHAQDIKWYDNYSHVKFFIGLLDHIEDFGINAEFVRIGEDYDDIVTEQYGDNIDYFLGVSRSIEGI